MVCFKHDAVKLLFQNHPTNQAKMVSKDGCPLEINFSAWKREGEVFRKKGSKGQEGEGSLFRVAYHQGVPLCRVQGCRKTSIFTAFL